MKLIPFVLLIAGILVGHAVSAVAQGALIFPYSWEPQARGGRPVSVPNAKVVYVDEPSIFVPRNGSRSMTLRARTTLSMHDTTRLKEDARPVAEAFEAVALHFDVHGINVQFENVNETIAAAGTRPPVVWTVTFLRDGKGRLLLQTPPRKASQLKGRP